MGLHRMGRLAACVLAATALLPPAPAGAADSGGLAPVVPILAPMLPGQRGWVAAIWTATTDVCDVQVTATGPGLTIGYPTNTATYTSLYTASALADGNIDYTALDITVPGGATTAIPVTMSVSYRRLPPGQIKKDDDLKTKHIVCSGPKSDDTVTATLPVLQATGASVLQKTTAVSTPKATPTWTNITFRGNRPNVGNFRVTLAPPAGLTVVYPNDGTSAGLAGGTALPVAQDDYVAVRLDATGLAPGTYTVPVHATYTGGSYDGQLSLTVT
jgi:hypothetical protein